MRTIDAPTARAVLHGGQEVAFLDVREAGQFGEGHALFAVPAPYSRLEPVVPRLVPRKDVQILLIDDGDGDGVAERAARALERLGYSAVTIVAGGMPAWAATGFSVYKGVNVPSKTLGELAEAIWHPAMVQPGTLQEWRHAGKPFRLFDARPPEEYAKMRVPGAVCLPNGELAHRLAAANLEEGQPLVVTCAGRTRGIVGVIGLRLAGHEGPVFALENGIQGWALAGFDLERGNVAAPYPALSREALEKARARAHVICARYGIPIITASQAERFLADESRATYLFDVRSREEILQDPLPAAVHAPSGQLVQATDQWVGVRRSRLVLADDGGLRAALAAFWLAQLGYEVHVVPIDDEMRGIVPPRRLRNISGCERSSNVQPRGSTVGPAVRSGMHGRPAPLLRLSSRACGGCCLVRQAAPSRPCRPRAGSPHSSDSGRSRDRMPGRRRPSRCRPPLGLGG